MPVLTIEQPLRKVLGDEASDSLIRLLDSANETRKRDVLEFVEEKFERRLSEEISGLEVRLTEKIFQVKTDLTTEISQVKTDLTTEISQVKTDLIVKNTEMIRWMFIFWVGQVAVLVGIIFAFFK